MTARKFALAFLFLANLIIVAHAVIPHHHHERIVCIISEHCSNDAEAHAHLAEAPHHSHDGNNNAENCTLKQLLVTPPHNSRGVSGLIANDQNNNSFPEFVTTLERPGIISSLLSQRISNREFPDIQLRSIRWITSSHGLRAPPLA